MLRNGIDWYFGVSMVLSSHITNLTIRALSSGSSGNCFLVEASGDALLIDCGLPV